MTINWHGGLIMNLIATLITSALAIFLIISSMHTGHVIVLWAGLFQVVCTIYLLMVTFNIGKHWTNNLFLR